MIEEANWLTLEEDLGDLHEVPEEGFDAVLCLGNSFSHVLVSFCNVTVLNSVLRF